MSLNRYAKARDANEPGIIKALERAGATVLRLDEPCDLLVGFRGRNHLLEVKNPKGKDRVTVKQATVFAWWRGTIHVVRTPEEAVYAVTLGRIDPKEPPQGKNCTP